jgi:hypothetical protein
MTTIKARPPTHEPTLIPRRLALQPLTTPLALPGSDPDAWQGVAAWRASAQPNPYYISRTDISGANAAFVQPASDFSLALLIAGRSQMPAHRAKQKWGRLSSNYCSLSVASISRTRSHATATEWGDTRSVAYS